MRKFFKTLFVFFGLLYADWKKNQALGGYVHDTVTRFMGLIVIAMRVQFVLSGM